MGDILGMLDVPLSPDHLSIQDLFRDDFPDAVAAADLTDFPDDAIAASLAAFSGGRDDDGDLELQALLSDRQSTRSPGMGTLMRSSFSMNDLTVLQHHHMPPAWNHNKLVSVKPKLQSVPEGAPSHGGPLNLMPLPAQLPLTCEPHSNGLTSLGMELQGVNHHGIPGLDPSMDDYVDFDSDVPGAMHKQLPSTGTLSQQLQMTHVTSDHQLAGAVDHFGRPNGMAPGLGAMQQQGMNAHSIFPANSHASQGTVQQPGQEQPHYGPGSQPVKRQATGLPLRKSQSAVELGSWRSFSGGEDVWDPEGLAGDLKPWKLSAEERLQRIQRYREKRQQRNFNRAVKYQCRKSLADSRPRVRGRFARNDDIGIVLPHETKKAARDRSGMSVSQDNSTDQSSGGTSSGGAPSQMGSVAPMSPYHMMAPSSHHHMGSPSLARLGSSPSGGMFGTPSRASSMPVIGPASMAGQPGVNMIGATPLPMLHPEIGMPAHVMPPGGVVAPPPPSIGVTSPPAMQLPNSFPPMPPVIGPSTGGMFSANSPGFPGMSPTIAYGSAGQSIFTGQTIFSGASLKLQPPSGSASAHPSMSPPPQPTSPTASDSHSHSQSVGLSIGDLSVGHSL